MSPSRNEACPCGSGAKFKRCCGAPGATPAPSMDTTGEGGAEVAAAATRSWTPVLILLAVAVGIGVGVGSLRGAAADGLAVGMALTMAVAVYAMSRNAPESTGRGSSSAINFGMSGRRAARRKKRQKRRR